MSINIDNLFDQINFKSIIKQKQQIFINKLNIIELHHQIAQVVHEYQQQMNTELKKLSVTAKVVPSKSIIEKQNNEQSQLFMPQQIQLIKLNALRSKRKQLQDKLRLISNRISYRRKKQEQELRRYIRTQQRSRVISQTKTYKKINSLVKQQLTQKKIFQQRKKAKQVEDFRMTTNRRLHLIYQSVRQRKITQSQKVRQLKKFQQQLMNSTKHEAWQQIKQKHQLVQKMKQRQMSKRQCYLVQKKLSFQQNILDQASVYQNQIQNYYKKIQDLKKNQQILKQRQQHAIEVLKCAQQNYQLLKQS